MQIYQASCFKMIQTMKKISLLGLCLYTKKGTLLTSFHIHSFVVFHSDLQKKTTVTCILTAWNHIMSNMQGCLLQLMQLIKYCHVSSFSTVITNHFIGEGFLLSQHSMDGFEAMGFDVTQARYIFSLETNLSIKHSRRIIIYNRHNILFFTMLYFVA